MKKQKLLALLMAAAMLLNMTACSKDEEVQPEEPETPAVETPAEPEKPKEEEKEEEFVLEVPELGESIAEYQAKNSDVVGWLRIPDTTIDEAVVQYTDNKYYYRRDNLGNEDIYSTGCYWMDFECLSGATAEDLGKATVIYGHNVDYGKVWGFPQPNPYTTNVGTDAVDEPTGDKFSQLFHYTDIDWAKDHPYIYFSTPEEDLVWEVFSVAYTSTDFRYIDVLQKGTKESITGEQMMELVEEGRERSEYDYNDVVVDEDDKILTLSTCTYKHGNRDDLRFIVMAKLVTEEDTVVETANITLNEDKIEVK